MSNNQHRGRGNSSSSSKGSARWNPHNQNRGRNHTSSPHAGGSNENLHYQRRRGPRSGSQGFADRKQVMEEEDKRIPNSNTTRTRLNQPGEQETTEEAILANLNKEKLVKLASLLKDVLHEGEEREELKWEMPTNVPELCDNEDNYSNVSSSIVRLSQDDDSLSGLSQNSFVNLSQRLSQVNVDYEYPSIGIFWDIENCPIPKGKSPMNFVKKIRDTFCEDYTEDKFLVVCNTDNQSPSVVKELHDVMVRVEYVPQSKNAADEVLRRNMREFAETKKPNTKVVLITGDINFNSEIHELRYKRHFNVVLIHNKQTTEALKICANECISFENFSEDVQEILPNQDDNESSTSAVTATSVTVVNIPRTVPVRKVKGRLYMLVKPFGGNVIQVNAQSKKAWINFPTPDVANQAINVLTGKDVYGGKIKLYRNNNDAKFKKSEPKTFDQIKKDLSDLRFILFHVNGNFSLAKMEGMLTKQIGSVQNLVYEETDKNAQCFKFMCPDLTKAKNLVVELQKNKLFFDISIIRREATSELTRQEPRGEKSKNTPNIFYPNTKPSSPKNFGSLQITSAARKEPPTVFSRKEPPTVALRKEPPTVPRNLLPPVRKTFDSVLVSAKSVSLTKHEKKCSTLKNRRELLNNMRLLNNPIQQEEGETLTKKIDLLNSMENEFMKMYASITDAYFIGNHLDAQTRMLFECDYFDKALPVYAYRGKIIDSMLNQTVTIISGSPESGKSPEIIEHLYFALDNDSHLVCTEPYEELVAYYGSIVSLHLKNVPIHEANKKITFVTDHTLLTECFTNKFLIGYTHVILDNVQEQTPETEMLLSHLKFILQRRDDLKVVILTTPEEAQTLSSFFYNSSIIDIVSATYPVEKIRLPATGSYIRDCVDKAIDLLELEGDGNILVFLPTTPEVNKAAELLKKEIVTKTQVAVYKLILDYNFRDVYTAIENSKLRCVILTTGSVERITSFPSVSFVIDSGLGTYSSFSNSYTYSEGSIIRKASSQYRAMKCAENQVGRYYYLHNKDSMTEGHRSYTNSSEKLVLYALRLELEPVNIDSAHPIPKQEIKFTIKDLEKMDAINGGKITEKGCDMTALTLAIHLSSLLINGIKNKLGYITMCFCAIASTSHLYDERINLMDILTEFLNSNTEVPMGRSNVSDKIEIIKSRIEAIRKIMKTTNPKHIKDLEVNKPIDWDRQLQKLLVSTWPDNLCVIDQRGHGYKWMNKEQIVQIYPIFTTSSPVQMFIFETILYSEATHTVTNVIPIAIHNLNTSMLEPHLQKQLFKQLEQEKTIIHPVGQHILRTAFLGKNGNLKLQWEEKLRNLTESLVNITISSLKGEIKIFSSKGTKGGITSMIRKEIEDAKLLLFQQVWEFGLKEDPFKRFIWGHKAAVTQLLTPDQFLSISIFVPPSESTEKILKTFMRYGNIVHSSERPCTKTNPRKQVTIIYNNPIAASNALAHKSTFYNVKPIKFNAPYNIEEAPPLITLNLQWTRRKNCKTAIITFDRWILEETIITRICNDKQGSCFADAEIDLDLERKRFLIRKLNPNVNRGDLEADITSKLQDLGLDFAVQLPQEPCYSSSDVEIESIQMEVAAFLTPHLGKHVEVRVCKPEDKDEVWTAYINPRRINVGLKVLDKIESEKFNSCKLKIRKCFTHNVYYSEDLFKYCQQEFIADLKRQKNEKSNIYYMNVTKSIAENGRVKVSIESNDMEDVKMVSQTLNTRMEGIRIDLSSYNFTRDVYFEELLLEEFNKISKKWKAFICIKKYANEVVVIGRPEALTDVYTTLNVKESKYKSLKKSIYHCNAPKGLIRTLFEQFGPDLKKLQMSVNSDYARIDVLTKTLNVSNGDQIQVKKALDTAISALRGINEKFKSEHACPVCNDDILKLDKHYRLEYCGHAYCYPCICGFISSAQTPVMCIVQGCSAPIVFRDLKNLYIDSPNLINSLAERALLLYISQHENDINFCPFPDCNGIATTDQCPKCFNKLCLSCNVAYHFGETCREYENSVKISVPKCESIPIQNTAKLEGVVRRKLSNEANSKSVSSVPMSNTRSSPIEKLPLDISCNSAANQEKDNLRVGEFNLISSLNVKIDGLHKTEAVPIAEPKIQTLEKSEIQSPVLKLRQVDSGSSCSEFNTSQDSYGGARPKGSQNRDPEPSLSQTSAITFLDPLSRRDSPSLWNRSTSPDDFWMNDMKGMPSSKQNLPITVQNMSSIGSQYPTDRSASSSSKASSQPTIQTTPSFGNIYNSRPASPSSKASSPVISIGNPYHGRSTTPSPGVVTSSSSNIRPCRSDGSVPSSTSTTNPSLPYGSSHPSAVSSTKGSVTSIRTSSSGFDCTHSRNIGSSSSSGMTGYRIPEYTRPTFTGPSVGAAAPRPPVMMGSNVKSSVGKRATPAKKEPDDKCGLM